jgi:pimeloyl-ACP methyl ester carboxylesterase
MLALAHSARHPDRVSCLVLVACGAFDWSSRESLREERERRMDLASRRRLDDLARDHPDPDDRLEAMAALLLPIYSHDLVTTDQEVESFDMQGHEETWSDMVRIQETGVYPDAFAAIDAPILMLHGTIDPHPGRMIRDSLARHVGRLEYREWKRCGHFPWMERAVREEFFAVLIGWLRRHAGGGS